MAMKKKIIAIIDTMYIGGAQKNIVQFLTHLSKQKEYEITLIALKKTNQYEIPKSINFVELIDENESIMQNLFPILQTITNYSKNADLIIGFIDYITNYIAFTVSELTNTKLILTSRSHLKENMKDYNSLSEINYLLTKKIYTNRNIIVQSKFIKEELEKYLKIDGKKIDILPNTIELTSVKKSKLEIFKDAKVFIVVSRFTKRKRIDVIIKAFSKLQKLDNSHNTKLLIIGYGEEKKSLENLTKKLNLTKKVEFKEESKNILSLFKSAHASIIASEFEGFANTILESMSQKTLVISSDIQANKELLQHKKTGLLFKVNNIDSLTQQMFYSLEKQKTITNLEHKAYKSLKKFTPEYNNKKLEQIIKKVLTSN